MNILTSLQPWFSAISPLISLGVIVLILRITKHMRNLYKDRLDAVKEKSLVMEERLKLAEDELSRIRDINKDLKKIGASLGIEDFKNQLEPGVSIRDIGDNFSGKIAGRDINELINDIGKMVDNSNDNIKNEIGEFLKKSQEYYQKYCDMSTKLYVQQDTPISKTYKLETLFSRGETLQKDFDNAIARNASEGWIFHTITCDYRGMEGCLLVFKKTAGSEMFGNVLKNFLGKQKGNSFFKI